MRELNAMQAAYWVGRRSQTPLGGVAAHLYAEFECPPLDEDRLRRALERLSAAHPMLRLHVTPDGLQTVPAAGPPPALQVDDMTMLAPPALDGALNDKRKLISHQMLTLHHSHAATFSLSRLPGGRCRLHVDADMIAVDPPSFRLMLEALAHFYAADAAPDAATASPAVPYFDWLDQMRADAALNRQRETDRAWWQARLPHIPEAPRLPWRPGLKPGGPVHSTRLTTHLSPDERRGLETAARQHRLTPSVLMLSLFAVVLGAVTGSTRFRLNVPLFHRASHGAQVDGIVGDFSNLLILGVTWRKAEPLTSLCRRITDEMAQMISHATYPGVNVMRDLSRHHGSMQTSPVVFTAGLDMPGGDLFSEQVTRTFGPMGWTSSQGAHVALDVQVVSAYGGILINWDVRLDALPEAWVRSLFSAYVALVRHVGRAPETLDRPWEAVIAQAVPEEAPSPPAEAEDSATERMLLQLLSRLAPGTPVMATSAIAALPLDAAALEDLAGFIATYLPAAALPADGMAGAGNIRDLARHIHRRTQGTSETVATALLAALAGAPEHQQQAEPTPCPVA